MFDVAEQGDAGGVEAAGVLFEAIDQSPDFVVGQRLGLDRPVVPHSGMEDGQHGFGTGVALEVEVWSRRVHGYDSRQGV